MLTAIQKRKLDETGTLDITYKGVRFSIEYTDGRYYEKNWRIERIDNGEYKLMYRVEEFEENCNNLIQEK